MATLYVRNVPEEVYEALRQQAKRNGRSISAETIMILRRMLVDPFDRLAGGMEAESGRPARPDAEEQDSA